MNDKVALTSRLLLITGTMGAGKSTVMGEASDLLAMRHIEHAAIDVDTLGVAYLSSATSNDEAMYANLACVGNNYARLGVRRFLMAMALEGPAELAQCRNATSAGETFICRLTANLATMEQRVAAREPGILQAEFVARVGKLNSILNLACLENFTIENENRPVTEVAHEMLLRAGWLKE
jgi:predicted kinase